MKVAALSAVTNFGTGMQATAPSHHETKEVADLIAPRLKALVRAFLKDNDHG